MMEFQPGNAAHLHRTDTVDYVICVADEIDMFLDDTQFTTLRAGDVLIQRGTCHAWANSSDKPCRLAVVLLDALPKRGLASARWLASRFDSWRTRCQQSVLHRVPPRRTSAWRG